MSITDRKDQSLNSPIRSDWDRVGTPRAIRKLPIGFPTAQPLVTSVRVYPEPTTQLAPVRSLLHCQPNKLSPLIHDRHLAPRHGWPSLAAEPMPSRCVGHAPEHLSGMS